MGGKYINNNDQDFSSRKKRPRSVFGAVSDKFRKLSGSAVRKKTGDIKIPHLTIMNIPPLAAKRDAAYVIVHHLLTDKSVQRSPGELLALYTDALQILKIAEKAHFEIIHTVARTAKKNETDAYGVFLSLLFNIVSSAFHILSSSAVICTDEQAVGLLFGRRTQEKTEEMLRLFSKYEQDLRHAVEELYNYAGGVIQKEQDKLKKNFTNDDLERYNASYNELVNKLGS